MSHYLEFFKQFRTTFETTGAIAPSSRFLASNMAEPMKRHQGPKRVLEIGPGTGAVTREIVKQIRPEDSLDLVELNEKFVEILHQRFDAEQAFQEIKHLTSIHNCPLQEYGVGEEYDYIVSGLPLNNFPTDLTLNTCTCGRSVKSSHADLKTIGSARSMTSCGATRISTAFALTGSGSTCLRPGFSICRKQTAHRR